MKTSLVWDDLQVAAVAARVGSQSSAARRLGISVATVGRRLDRLEGALGLRLFHRHASGLSPTPEATSVLARAQALAGDVDQLVRAAAAESAGTEGVVTVSTLETIVTQVIVPRLGRLRAKHPRLDLVLRSTSRIVRLDRRAADLAVRVVRPNEARVVGRKLGTLRYGLYATAAYLERRDVDPDDLRGHDVVMFDEAWDALPEMVWLSERMAEKAPALRVVTASAMTAAVASGAMLGVVPTLLASDEMVQLLGPEALPSRDLWLVMHEDLRRAPAVRAVADFFVEIFGEALHVASTS